MVVSFNVSGWRFYTEILLISDERMAAGTLAITAPPSSSIFYL